MLKPILRALALAAALAAAPRAQDKGLGVGVLVGDPNALALKVWTNAANAIDIAAGWSTYYQVLYGQADYVWHNYDLIRVNQGRLPVYYGVGARLVAADKARAGLRLVGGLAYQFPRSPFDIYAEVAPVFDFIPSTGPGVNGGIGFHYFL